MASIASFLKMSFALALIFYIGAAALLYFTQRSILYIPPKLYVTPQGADLLMAVEVFAADDPAQMIGWYIAPQSDDAPVILYFHGNGSAVYSARDIYRAFHAKGWGVMVVAYPGYPGANGAPTQESLTQASLRAQSYVSAKGITQSRVVYYGTSLGAGVAAQLSAAHPPALLVMEAPFQSVQARAQNMLPLFPASLLIKDKFRSDLALEAISVPMVWLHGTNDNVIPIAEGRALFDGYNGPKTDHIIQGGGHNDVWFRGGDQVIIAAIAALEDSIQAP